jgi:hypothetical protein
MHHHQPLEKPEQQQSDMMFVFHYFNYIFNL